MRPVPLGTCHQSVRPGATAERHRVQRLTVRQLPREAVHAPRAPRRRTRRTTPGGAVGERRAGVRVAARTRSVVVVPRRAYTATPSLLISFVGERPPMRQSTCRRRGVRLLRQRDVVGRRPRGIGDRRTVGNVGARNGGTDVRRAGPRCSGGVRPRPATGRWRRSGTSHRAPRGILPPHAFWMHQQMCRHSRRRPHAEPAVVAPGACRRMG